MKKSTNVAVLVALSLAVTGLKLRDEKGSLQVNFVTGEAAQ